MPPAGPRIRKRRQKQPNKSVTRRRTHVVCTGGRSRGPRGNQPLRASWWQQSFRSFLRPHPDSGHQGWDWRVPEGTELHSGCFILSYPTANRVCVFLPWVWFYNLESEQHAFQPPNFDPRKTAAKFRQTTTFPPKF